MPMLEYLKNALLDHVFGDTAFTMPTPYLALIDDGNAEITTSGTAYARMDMSGKFAAASGGVKVTNAAFDFAAATADWGIVTKWRIYDNSSGGNAMWEGTFATPRTVLTGDTFHVASGDLTHEIDDPA